MSDFEWLSKRQIDALDIESHPNNDPFDYFLEVDLSLCMTRIMTSLLRPKRVRFKQGDFLKDYITHNNRCRKNAKHDFEVSLFKLYNNCINANTIYNVFKQLHVQLVSDAAKFQRL